jgi:indole-3-glycerol phosphate synthase
MDQVQSMAGDFLTRILRDKRAEVDARRREEPLADLARRAAQAPAPRPAQWRSEHLRVIAEIKRGSPSAGTFNATLDAAAQAHTYAEGGATAISVLTDAPYFQGSLADLRAVRSRVQTPLLRKDFIIDAYQLYESRAAGADLVLLIVAALEPDDLQALYGEALALDLQPLVEVNTAEEAQFAASLGATLVGINNRNLHTFTVDLDTTARLRPLLPPATVVAALSGVRTVADARLLRAAGADAVLVGEALVRATDPAALLAALGAV